MTYITLFMTKVFDILLDLYNGLQMLHTQLHIRLQEPSKDYKKSFQLFRVEWKNKIHQVGKSSMKTESSICDKHFEYRYLEISLKCCCSGLILHIRLKWTQILCTTLLVLLAKA